MKVGVIQSSYIPWRGYFDFIASVDVFVFHDDIQYTKSDWRNRNRIKTSRGTEWLTVPVRYNTVSQKINETIIDYSQPWNLKHIHKLEEAYRKSIYSNDMFRIVEAVVSAKFSSISELNIFLIGEICNYLKIDTKLRNSSEFGLSGKKTERLIDLLEKLNASMYVSGPNADAYLDKEAFRKSGIRLEYKSYVYDPYPQLWGDFIGEVSVLDLIANCGPMSRDFLRSKVPNQVIVDRI